MIPANELRIGNWVKAAIRLDFADYKTPEFMQVDVVMIRDCQHYKDNWAWEEIPLTPEILEQCGFKVSEYWGYSHEHLKCRWVTREITGDNIDRPFLRFDSIAKLPTATDIYNLHQLQNLYFALTNKELEVHGSVARNDQSSNAAD